MSNQIRPRAPRFVAGFASALAAVALLASVNASATAIYAANTNGALTIVSATGAVGGLSMGLVYDTDPVTLSTEVFSTVTTTGSGTASGSGTVTLETAPGTTTDATLDPGTGFRSVAVGNVISIASAAAGSTNGGTGTAASSFVTQFALNLRNSGASEVFLTFHYDYDYTYSYSTAGSESAEAGISYGLGRSQPEVFAIGFQPIIPFGVPNVASAPNSETKNSGTDGPANSGSGSGDVVLPSEADQLAAGIFPFNVLYPGADPGTFMITVAGGTSFDMLVGLTSAEGSAQAVVLPPTVPAPPTLALMLVGIVGAAFASRRRAAA